MLYVGEATLSDSGPGLVIVFGPSRSFVSGVRIGGVLLQRLPADPASWLLDLPSGVKKGTTVHIELDAIGETPNVLTIGVLLDQFGILEVGDKEYSPPEWAQLLNERALVVDGDVVCKKFFLYFDVWCTPGLASILRTSEFVDLLSHEANRTFSPAPSKDDPSSLFVTMAGELSDSASSRPYYLLYEGGRTPRLCVCDDTKIQRVAEYLWALFQTLPTSLRPGGSLMDGLEAAFTKFACGALAFLPPNAAISAINAEPDSCWFFAFAEFSFQACVLSEGEVKKTWFGLARLFAVLIEPFSMVYGPILEGRGPCKYDRRNRQRVPDGIVERTLSLLDLQKELIPYDEDLSKLQRFYTAQMMWAVRDEAIQSNSVCKLVPPAQDRVPIALPLPKSL